MTAVSGRARGRCVRRGEGDFGAEGAGVRDEDVGGRPGVDARGVVGGRAGDCFPVVEVADAVEDDEVGLVVGDEVAEGRDAVPPIRVVCSSNSARSARQTKGRKAPQGLGSLSNGCAASTVGSHSGSPGKQSARSGQTT